MLRALGNDLSRFSPAEWPAPESLWLFCRSFLSWSQVELRHKKLNQKTKGAGQWRAIFVIFFPTCHESSNLGNHGTQLVTFKRRPKIRSGLAWKPWTPMIVHDSQYDHVLFTPKWAVEQTGPVLLALHLAGTYAPANRRSRWWHCSQSLRVAVLSHRYHFITVSQHTWGNTLLISHWSSFPTMPQDLSRTCHQFARHFNEKPKCSLTTSIRKFHCLFDALDQPSMQLLRKPGTSRHLHGIWNILVIWCPLSCFFFEWIEIEGGKQDIILMKVTCIVSVSKQLLYSVDLQYDFWSHQIYERETKKNKVIPGHPPTAWSWGQDRLSNGWIFWVGLIKLYILVMQEMKRDKGEVSIQVVISTLQWFYRFWFR